MSGAGSDGLQGKPARRAQAPTASAPAIRYLYELEQDRIIVLIQTHIRLGIHPDKGKTAREVTIPKPGKDDYSVA